MIECEVHDIVVENPSVFMTVCPFLTLPVLVLLVVKKRK